MIEREQLVLLLPTLVFFFCIVAIIAMSSRWRWKKKARELEDISTSRGIRLHDLEGRVGDSIVDRLRAQIQDLTRVYEPELSSKTAQIKELSEQLAAAKREQEATAQEAADLRGRLAASEGILAKLRTSMAPILEQLGLTPATLAQQEQPASPPADAR